MRVWTKVVMVWSDEEQRYVTDQARSTSFDYEGPVALCGGGPSPEQRQAASSQANLTAQTAKIAGDNQQMVKDQFAKIDPYATSRLQNGLPFKNALTDFSAGTNAQAYAPARAAMLRGLSRFGSALPSGFKTQAMNDFEENRAHAFDSDQVNNLMGDEAAKGNAASVLTGQQQIANPLGYTSAAMQGNQSIMQAPLQKAGMSGLLGGAVSGAMSAIPF